MFERLPHFFSRFSWIVLVLATFATTFALQQALKLKVDTNLQALMPSGVPSVENLNKALEKTGSFSSAIVVITSPDPDAGLRFADAMRRRVLLELDWVASADYSEDFSLFEAHKLLYLSPEDLESLKSWVSSAAGEKRDEIIRELTGLPVNITLRSQPGPRMTKAEIEKIRNQIYDSSESTLSRKSERIFQSKDKQVTLLVVWPKNSDMGYTASKRIITDLERLAKETNPKIFHPQLTAELGGRIYNRVVQFEAVMTDVNTSGYISISLILLLLLAYYRSFIGVLLIVLPLASGIILTMGITQIVIGGLNLVTVFLILIIFGLGIDFGIHNLSRYNEARLQSQSVKDGLVTIFKHTGSATLLCAVTTIAGFYALLITDFRAFYEFGFIAGTGVALTFIVTYIIQPALIVLAENYKIYKPRMGKVFRLSAHNENLFSPTKTFLFFGIILTASVVLASKVHFENNFNNLQAERSPAQERVQEKISMVFPDGTDRAVLIVDTLAEVKAITDYFKKYIATDTKTPTIRKVDSILSYVPDKDEQQRRLKKIKEINTSLGGAEIKLDVQGLQSKDFEKYLNIGEVKPEDLPEGLKRVYQGLPDTPGFLIYIFNAVTMSEAELAQAFASDIQTIKIGNKTYHPAAEALIFVDMLNLMKSEALLAILASCAATFLALLIFLRQFSRALLVITPPLIGLLLLFGIMGLFDIKLSIFNMVALPSIIGIGVDNSIHIYYRFREENGDIKKAILATRGAVAASTITTALGFFGMLTAKVNGLQSLGLLSTIGLACCLLVTWTLLPALLSLLKKPFAGPVNLK